MPAYHVVFHWTAASELGYVTSSGIYDLDRLTESNLRWLRDMIRADLATEGVEDPTIVVVNALQLEQEADG